MKSVSKYLIKQEKQIVKQIPFMLEVKQFREAYQIAVEGGDPNNINKAFDNYIKEAIEYFKILDETDLFQEDYIGLQILDEMELEEEEEKVEKINDEEIIKTFMLPKNNVPNLDNFVKIKKTQEEKIVKLPVQKEINLFDNQYKTKGIQY